MGTWFVILVLVLNKKINFNIIDKGQIGRHTPEHAKAVAVANVLPKLLQLYMRTDLSEDLQTKSKKALKNILQKCNYLPVLEPLLHEASPNILKHVVAQFSKVLPHDPKARRLFVTSGGLKKVFNDFIKLNIPIFNFYFNLFLFRFKKLKLRKVHHWLSILIQ